MSIEHRRMTARDPEFMREAADNLRKERKENPVSDSRKSVPMEMVTLRPNLALVFYGDEPRYTGEHKIPMTYTLAEVAEIAREEARHHEAQAALINRWIVARANWTEPKGKK